MVSFKLCEIITNDADGRHSQGHFQLQTLYCHDDLDISQIIKSQTDLQILGLYTSRSIILKTVKELHEGQFLLPIVVTLKQVNFVVVGHIGIFPSLCSVYRRATIHQVLAQLFCKDQGNCKVSKADNIVQLSFYLIDDSDMPSIYALAKDMAISFPRIDLLNLCFKRRCEIVSYCSIDRRSNRAISKGNIYLFSHYRSLKKSSLSSPICLR